MSGRVARLRTEDCGNIHCTEKRLDGQLACWGCWSALPTKLRFRITDTRRNTDANREAVLEAEQRWSRIAGVI